MYCLACRINIAGKGTQRLIGSDAISNLLDRQPAGDLSRCHYFCQAHGYLPSFSAHRRWPVLIITSPAGEDAKYCDEYVCLCVYLSAKISPEPLAPTLANFLCMLPMSVARSFSGMLKIGRIAYRREGVTGVQSAGEMQSAIALFILLCERKHACERPAYGCCVSTERLPIEPATSRSIAQRHTYCATTAHE